MCTDFIKLFQYLARKRYRIRGTSIERGIPLAIQKWFWLILFEYNAIWCAPILFQFTSSRRDTTILTPPPYRNNLSNRIKISEMCKKKVIKKPYWRRAAHTFSACLNQNISSSSVTHNYPYTGNEWKNEWIKPRTITARKIFMAVYVPLLSLLCYNYFFSTNLCATLSSSNCRLANVTPFSDIHKISTHTHTRIHFIGGSEREKEVFSALCTYIAANLFALIHVFGSHEIRIPRKLLIISFKIEVEFCASELWTMPYRNCSMGEKEIAYCTIQMLIDCQLLVAMKPNQKKNINNQLFYR